MIPLTAGGMFRQYGDGRFCELPLRQSPSYSPLPSLSLSPTDKTPALKATVIGVSACSVLYRVLAARATSPRVGPWSLLSATYIHGSFSVAFVVGEIVGVSQCGGVARGCSHPHFLPTAGETAGSRQVCSKAEVCHVTGLISHVTSCLVAPVVFVRGWRAGSRCFYIRWVGLQRRHPTHSHWSHVVSVTSYL